MWSRIYCSKFRGSFNGVCVSALLFFLVYKDQILQSPFLRKPSLNFPRKSSFKIDFQNSEHRRRIYEKNSPNFNLESSAICTEIHQQKGSNSKCDYLKSHPECDSGGYLNYMMFFYCECDKIEPIGYAVLFIWLIALLYLLGNTAADYFCCSLEMLSNLLKLPPTVAGVTLLPLGNGAPDVFASIAAFVGSDSGGVGLNSVLGGAIFVTCIVVGAVCLCVSETNIQIDRKCFMRDVGFFLIALVSLLVILLAGEVNFWGAIMFVSVYVVYALCVAGTEVLRKYGGRFKLRALIPLLPVTDEAFENSPLLRCDDMDDVPFLQSELPHSLWATKVAIYSVKSNGENQKYLWGWNEMEEEDTSSTEACVSFSSLCSLLEIPLAIPRRLTIPIVDERRWSKAYAVGSACFAPILCTFLWGSSDLVYPIFGTMVGATLGLLALIYTSKDHPPQRFVLPWVIGGFLMSIMWFYIIANELVALLVALGLILKIKASLLGLTILAWGNSMGDLVSNVAIAMNGGNGGVQVAMSGCYAGPMFNTLVGLGLSLLIAAWSEKPRSYVVPNDSSLYFTLGFLVLSLVWALVVLPRNDMRPTRVLGIGLIVIYFGFLSLRISMALGDGSFN